MSCGQHPQLCFAGIGEAHPHHSLIVLVRDPLDQTPFGRSVDELDGTVVSQHEVFGDIADADRTAMTADREQQLVMRRRQTSRLRLILAPPEELPETVPKLEQRLVLVIIEPTARRGAGVVRDICCRAHMRRDRIVIRQKTDSHPIAGVAGVERLLPATRSAAGSTGQ